jgi:hypothetical protein
VTLSTVRGNRLQFEAFERDLALTDSDEAQLVYIRDASTWTISHHSGIYASQSFEDHLAAVGRRLCDPSPLRPPGNVEHVLHVLTAGYDVGGHTRVTERWMQFDAERAHTVVMTVQAPEEVPRSLIEASQGRIRFLGGSTLSEKVQSLSRQLSQFDVVVLNIHPDDPIAPSACAGTPMRPRTLLMNHADHLFWIGLCGADDVLDFRPSGDELVRRRRIFDRPTPRLLPLPILDPFQREGSGDDVRHRLGIDPSSPVSLTMANPEKFGPVGRQVLVSLLATLLDRTPELHHLAMGVDDDNPDWRSLKEAHPGRVHLLGRHRNTDGAFRAATMFFDCYPFSSITSALEAASFGLPILSLVDERVGLLGFDDLGLKPHRAHDASSWLACARRWAASGDLARHDGLQARAQCLGTHGRTPWLTSLEDLYASSWQRSSEPLRIATPEDPTTSDVAIERIFAPASSSPPGEAVPWSEFDQAPSS